MKRLLVFFIMFFSMKVFANQYNELVKEFMIHVAIKQEYEKAKEQSILGIERNRQDLLQTRIAIENDEVYSLTNDFFDKAIAEAESVMDWNKVENEFFDVVKGYYSEKELIEINSFLSGEVGKKFITNYSSFAEKSREIELKIGAEFREKISSLENNYNKNVSKILNQTR